MPRSMTTLQRSRRSSRRTSPTYGDPSALPLIGFNGAVVLHDGQGRSCPCPIPRATPLQRSRRSSRRTSIELGATEHVDPVASTEPSFFTTDKVCEGVGGAPSLPASTEPSFFTTDKPLWSHPYTYVCVSLQRSRRSSRRTSSESIVDSTSRPRFNGAVVLHDGQAPVWMDIKPQDTLQLQRSRRSSRRTSPELHTGTGLTNELQRSRRSSRRTRTQRRKHLKVFQVRFNGAVVLHDGQAHQQRHPEGRTRGFNGAVVLHDGQALKRASSTTHRSGFNGAVVLHDGQGAFASIVYTIGATASTEPSFFTTDKECIGPTPASIHALQRSRRSSRRTRRRSRRPSSTGSQLQRSRRSSRRTRPAAPSGVFAIAVLQRSRRSSRRTSTRHASRLRHFGRASTEPSFFTTDKQPRNRTAEQQQRASTEPSFFTTDKARVPAR